MDESGGHAGFLLEASTHAGEGFGLRSEYLDRDGALEPFVEGVEDPGHAAFAQQTGNAIATTDHPGDDARLHPCCVPPTRGG